MSTAISITEADISSCKEWRERAIQYGWEPESWKWAWILIWYGGQWNREMWRNWLCSFIKTQYSFTYRIAFIGQYFVRGLIYVIRKLWWPRKVSA